MKLAVGVRKTIKEMRGFERRLAVEPALRRFKLRVSVPIVPRRGAKVSSMISTWAHVELRGARRRAGERARK